MRNPGLPQQAAAVVESLDTRLLCVVAGGGKIADVSVQPVSVITQELIAGTKAKFSLDFLNVGTAPADGKVNVSLFASRDKSLVLLGDRRLGGVTPITMNDLDPGESLRRTLSVILPADLPAANYNIFARIEPTFKDKSTRNNTVRFPSPVSIQRPATGGADLSLAFGTLPDNIPFGVPNTIPFTLRNTGTADYTKGLQLRLFSSDDKIFGNADDRLLTSFNYNKPVKAKSSTNLSYEFMTPSDFFAGPRFLAAQVKPNTAIPGTNLKNDVTFSRVALKF